MILYLTISHIYNESKNNHIFPSSLKLADIIPTQKKDKKFRPISLLPMISKLFEKYMSDQIVTYIDQFLSPYLFGFRKGHSTQQCLIVMIETWKKALDEQKYAGAILTDLTKAFDCLNHDLLLVKLKAYGFDNHSLKFIQSYLRERRQRTKVGSSFSSWQEIKFGVPQGSILGPLLFNIFLNDIFYFTGYAMVTNYADGNTIYSINDDIQHLLKTLETETSVLLKWFKDNEMKANADKCHLLVAKHENVSVKLESETITGDISVELLGLDINGNLNCSEHVRKLCTKGNQKFHALARISKYLSKNNLRILMKTFIESQFNYCPLIWMFHNRSANNKINRLHERALRLVYNNDKYTFQELLELDNTVTVHDRNLQKLAIEMYKAKNNISPKPMQDIFEMHRNNYNLRNRRCWKVPKVRTGVYGTETLRYRGPKTWEMLPSHIKDCKTLIEFKRKVKEWKPDNCTCRLCKKYIFKLGFIE